MEEAQGHDLHFPAIEVFYVFDILVLGNRFFDVSAHVVDTLSILGYIGIS